MDLTVATREQASARAAAKWGKPTQDETLLDLIRAEVTARRSCPRWTALQRLAEALGDNEGPTRGRLHELCGRLEYEGDITLSSGGVLHVSPVRAIQLQVGLHRIVCSLPGHRLRNHLSGELEVDGVRRLHRFDPTMQAEAESAVQKLGGVVLSPKAWAGLDLAPIANESWIQSLDQRLELEPEPAGSLERDGALEWNGLVVAPDGPRWRRKPDEPTRLWRARTSYGRWIWAWGTADNTPSADAFITLFADEANRTLFALARAANRGVSASVVRDDAVAQLRLREWLPRAEYRYLTSISSPSRVESHHQWPIPLVCVDEVLDTLSRRLGLEVTEETSW